VSDTTHDVAAVDNDGFHEIQLSGKQLVFLFMATTVVSVVIFLTGVLVGRDVRRDRPADTTDAALTTPAPAAVTPTPPPSQSAAQQASPVVEPPSPPADDELTYRKRLEGEGAPAEQLKPRSAPEARPDAKSESAKAEVKQEPPPPARPAADTAAKAPSDTPAAGARPGRWVVQLVALRDRGAASSIVQRLSGKGYPAFMVNPSASTPNQVFKVQVGRYDDRNEAERVSRRLKKEEKFNPWISR
jgi:cell division septation protein DedD